MAAVTLEVVRRLGRRRTGSERAGDDEDGSKATNVHQSKGERHGLVLSYLVGEPLMRGDL
jgi:hypothetical protein